MESKGVYIHIPFCKSICSYCDFCKMFYYEKWAKEYLESLKHEIEDLYNGEDIETIYIGGGTPSSLSSENLKALFEIIHLFRIENLKECTFECNINDVNEEVLRILKHNRVNRLSIGIQSFHEEKLRQMNRRHNYQDVKEKIELCRRYGFSNINIDFIYGFDFENKKEIKEDLQQILSLNPEHISTYSLMIEKNTPLYLKHVDKMNEDEEAEAYKMICKLLKKQGYFHYEISNFSKKGYESLHNLRYWKNLEYYGFGLSASGYLDKVRYTNTYSLTKYLKNDYRKETEFLTQKDIMDNHLMLGFRLLKGFNVKEFEELYQVNLKKTYPIQPLLKNGDLILKKGNIFINPDKLYIMNEILLKMI